MDYKIAKGDRFLCLENYIMYDGRTAYTKGKIYLSQIEKCLTDDDFDIHHEMEYESDFTKYFRLVVPEVVS